MVRVALARQQFSQAVEILERFREPLDHPADIEKRLEGMALYVVALYQAGKRAQAELVASRLLAMTEPEGYIRLYLDAGEPMRRALETLLEGANKEAPDFCEESGGSRSSVPISRSYLSRLLAAFEPKERRPPPGNEALPATTHKTLPHFSPKADLHMSIEPLSPQEQRVLRLLVAGQTYAEMAQALVVSPNTIKTQISSIYRKLGVSRRAEAIAMATHLHLL